MKRMLRLFMLSFLLVMTVILPARAGGHQSDEDRIWVTKDGRELRYGDMATDHLRNTSAMLRRIAKTNRLIAADACKSKVGEVAQMAADAACLEGPMRAARDESAAEAMDRVAASRNSNSGR